MLLTSEVFKSWWQWEEWEGEGIVTIQGMCGHVAAVGKAMTDIANRKVHYSGKCLKRCFFALLS